MSLGSRGLQTWKRISADTNVRIFVPEKDAPSTSLAVTLEGEFEDVFRYVGPIIVLCSPIIVYPSIMLSYPRIMAL